MMKASQKVGAETPITDTSRATWSIGVSRFTAAITPNGIETTSDSRKAIVASSMVAGAYCRMSSRTGLWVEMDSPRSPRVSPWR